MKDSNSLSFDERMKLCWDLPQEIQDAVYAEIDKQRAEAAAHEADYVAAQRRMEVVEEQNYFAEELLDNISLLLQETELDMFNTRKSTQAVTLIKSIRDAMQTSSFEKGRNKPTTKR
jgi:hypothetical protein